MCYSLGYFRFENKIIRKLVGCNIEMYGIISNISIQRYAYFVIAMDILAGRRQLQQLFYLCNLISD